MEFEFDEYTDRGECVAYIDTEGDLMFKPSDCEADIQQICIDKDGFLHTNLKWMPQYATRKFYKGDKITITF